ncbi:MAG: PPC domain-containing protein [Verrucomicrobiota bacterium]
MIPPTLRFTSLLILLLAAASIQQTNAQLPSAELHTIFPAAAAAGSTIEVDLAGTHLDKLTGLHFSDPRIRAAAVMLPADNFHPTARPNGNKFKVTLPADMQAGIYEVRSVGYFGLSNARPFVVLPAKTKILSESGIHSSKEKATPIELEQNISGHSDPEQVDFYKFTAKKGQRLLIHCLAERLDSRLDSLLVLYDENGHQVARNQNHFGRDSMIDFTAKTDGDYYLTVSDALYRGGGQYHYQITVSARPHIDFIYPPAGAPGSKGSYTLYGRNLPGGSLDANQSLNGMPLESLKVEIQIPAKTEKSAAVFHPGKALAGLLPGFEYRFKNSNAIRIGFSGSPVIQEDQKNKVQKIIPPVEIAGRFETITDQDSYRFTAKKGSSYWLEAISSRMEAGTDPYLVVEKITKTAKGDESYVKIADKDDPPALPNDTLNLTTRDSALFFTADQDGDYQVSIVNQYKNGDISRLYRLAIRPAQPDFQVLAVSERDYLEARQAYPAAALLRQAGTYAYRILTPRRDGFDGDITVTASGLPKGVSATPAVISGKNSSGFLILTAAADAADWAGHIRLSGQATINKQLVTHQARTVGVVWGTADYNKDRLRSRLSTRIPLAVSNKEKAPAALALTDNKKWIVEIGKKLELPFKVSDPGNRKGNLTIQPIGLPGMKKPPTTIVAEKKEEGKITLDFASNGNFKPIPGTYQFFLKATGLSKYENNPAAAKQAEDYKKRLEKLALDLTAADKKAAAVKVQAQKTFDAARKNTASASAAAKAELNKQLTAAKAALHNASQKSAAANAKSIAANKEKNKAIASAKAAATKAKAKDVKFAIYSSPLTVEIKAAAKAPAKK